MLKIHTKSNEIWKDIEGYEGLYQISNFGRVKSLSRLNHCGHKGSKPLRINEYIRKPQITPKGYLNIKLSKDGVSTSYQIHRLVGQAFIPNPNNLPQINHIDEVKTNNIVNNLEWCTNLQNARHGDVIERRGNSIKRPILEFNMIGEFVGKHDSSTNVAVARGHGTNGIYRCCNGYQKTAYGSIWRYVDD